MIAYSPGGQVTLDSLTSFRSMRWDHQLQTNPYFFNGPFTGVQVQPAAYTFSKSEEWEQPFLKVQSIADVK